MMAREWLHAFLGSRGLEKPDGRLLWNYDCSDREYRSLVDLLEQVGSPSHLRHKYSYGVRMEEQAPTAEDEDLTMPAFVLFSSEWFRREWNGKTRDVWKGMMNEVAWPSADYWQLYPAMATGLAWWDHRFIEIIKTQYLGTFAYQSGRIRVTGLRT